MCSVKPHKMQTVKIPWGSWYADDTCELSFPGTWDVNSYSISDAPRMDDSAIRTVFQNPAGTAPLREIAAGRRNVVIAVEDITRPVRMERILKNMLYELENAGVSKTHIKIVICNGAHAPMLKDDLIRKLGKSIVSEFLILNHNPYDNLSDTGVVLGKTPVRVNRVFYEADLRIIAGTIMPHSFAGFSSGGKLVLPGLSDIATLERTHKYVMMGFRGGVNDVEKNSFRFELEETVREIGIDFFAGVVPNSRRETAGVFAGDFVEAHREGVAFARAVFRTDVRPACDIAVLNAYPKDSELLQADTALTPLKTMSDELIREGGTVVIATKCSNGYGYHSLFGPGMRLSRKPIKRRFLKDRDVIVFAPGINLPEFHTLYWEKYTLANSWAAVLSILQERFPDTCRVSVLPTAPLQLLTCTG